MHPRATELIRLLELEPHPEGGHYREIFRSSSGVTTHDERGTRHALTTIYFLLNEGEVSRWHRVWSDEVWHLYEGGPLELFDVDLDSRTARTHRLESAAADGGRPVQVIEAGHWQAARPLGAFALMGCTVGPGFDFADFRLMTDEPEAAQVVRDTWPALAALI